MGVGFGMLRSLLVSTAGAIVLAHKASKPLVDAKLSQANSLLEIYYFDQTAPGHIELISRDGRWELDPDQDLIPFAAACGFIATCDETRKRISALQQSMAERLSWLAGLECEVLNSEDLTQEGILGCVVSLLAGERKRLLERNARLSNRAAIARRQFEQVQRNIVDLTQVLRLCAPEGVVTALEYLPATGQGSGIMVPMMGASATCAQRLPVALRGLAGVELFIEPAGVRSGSKLSVTLSSAEDGFTHALWRFDLDAVQDDTIRLVLPRALDTLEFTPIVSITAEKEVLRRLRLGPPHPDPGFCGKVDGNKTLSAPLAMRIRTALPGRPLSHAPGALMPLAVDVGAGEVWDERGEHATTNAAADGAGEKGRSRMLVSALHALGLGARNADPVRTMLLDADTMSRVRHISETPPGIGFGIVYHWPEKEGIMVHPLEGSTTVACIPGLVGGGFKRLTAWLQSLREDGPPVEMAIAIGSDDERVRSALNGDRPEGAVLMSGWSGLAAGHSGRLELFSSTTVSPGANLYVATRLGPGATSHHHAWIVLKSAEIA